MSEIERIIDSLDRKALADAMTDPIKTSLSYGAIGRKLLLVNELPQDKIYRLIDFIEYSLKTICNHGALPQRLPNGCSEYMPISYYLEGNYDAIFGLGLNIYYLGKEDFKVHIQYLHERGSLVEFLGEHYTNCERIYNLSKIYVNEE
jgi:hypothetical protein